MSSELLTPALLSRVLDDAPDPGLARVAMARLGEQPGAREMLAQPLIAAAAVRLLGFSSAVADLFVAHPEELRALEDVRARTSEELTEEVLGDASRLGWAAGIRRFRRRAAARIAARDLGGALVDEVMLELSYVAEACIRAALAVTADHDYDVAVIGLGKLGGSELNYSSDVDVLFVHRGSGSGSQDAASRTAAALVALLSDPTEDGVALRVDPNLRPEGRSGPLSRSLDSMLAYYERHAATWERQALLKARPVAGDPGLGEEFVAGVAPFVFPSVLPSSAVDDVRASKARIEERVRALGKQDVELKRGRGGIRDVEFAVQLLQLVHGRRDQALRDTNTLRALRSLADGGFVRRADADALSYSYCFLRRLEHRLQMVRDVQTHELPTDRRSLATLARAMGLSDAAELRAEYERNTGIVRELHERLFYRPLMDALAAAPASASAPPQAGVDRASTEELLAGLGFLEPSAAYELLQAVADPSTRLGKVLGSLFPVIGPELATAAVPDAALVRLSRVSERLLHEPADAEDVADALADRPDAARRLAALLSASSTFADSLVAHPQLVKALYELPQPGPTLFPGYPEGALVRVAGAYAGGELGIPDTGRRITDAADDLIAGIVGEQHASLPLAVIGFGKLGGRELSFASDLDVMFVHDGDGPEALRTASESAERVVARIREQGWRVDADLRPEGRSGPLARSMASYLEYWERWAEMWEYQALLRARFIAGDELLGRRFVSNGSDFAYPEALSLEQVVAVRRMRVRMEEERVRPKGTGRFNFKLGYGALADVQFATELLLLRHGFAHPSVRLTNTLEALERLAEERLVEGSVVLALSHAYTFLTGVKLALEIEQRVPAEALPAAPEAQTALARRLGYAEMARSKFVQDYMRITRRARQAMERVFYPEDPAE